MYQKEKKKRNDLISAIKIQKLSKAGDIYVSDYGGNKIRLLSIASSYAGMKRKNIRRFHFYFNFDINQFQPLPEAQLEHPVFRMVPELALFF